MSISQWITTDMIPALCRTLLHSLWLGLLAAFLAAMILIATKKATASIRYNLLVFLFALLMVSTGIVFINELRSSHQNLSVSSTALIEQYKPITIIIDGETNGISENNNYFNSLLHIINQYAIYIISAWFLLFLFRIGKMIMGLKHINLIRNKKTHPADHYWIGWLFEKAKQMNIGQRIILLQSELVKVPVAIGYLKPVILVPLGLVSQLSPQQVETILLHELAHIKRKDYLVNLLQTIIDAIFFFNPAFVWISSLIRQERENCCDDIVIAQTSNQGDYFEALMCFQSKNFTKTYAMALGTRKQSLLHRVKRMLTRENSILTTKEIYSLLCGLVITAFCFMAFQPKPQLASLATLRFQDISLNSIKPEPTIISLKPEDAKKWQTLDPLPALKTDTIPQKPGKIKAEKNKAEKQKEKIRFKKIISNISDDGTNSVQQIQATSSDGTVYKLRKVEDEIKSFTINGKEIAKEDYSRNYNMIISSINHEAQIRNKEAIRAKQKRQQEISRKQSQMAARQARINKERKIKMDSVKKQRANQNIQAKQRSQQSYKASKIKQSGNSTLNAIIQDLLSSKIAQNETSLSFTLNNSGLIVNGIAQPQAVFEQFRSKYLKSTEDRFKYLREGNSTSTEIYIK